MASTKSTPTTTIISPDAYRAFADFLSAGGTGSFDEWYASEAGQTALTAFADQAKAAARSQLMADAKAIWRDFKENSEVTIYSREHGARMLTYLSGLDFDAIVAEPASTEASTEATDSK